MTALAHGAEVEPVMSADDARRITERIRLTAHNAREALEKLPVLVDEAKAGNAHVALGYASWTAYLSDVLGQQPLRLERDQRQEIVGYLSGEGLSTRAIAPIVGVHHDTVATDLRPRVGNPTPAAPAPVATGNVHPVASFAGTTTGAVAHVDTRTGEITPAPAPRPVTGLDGKAYTRRPTVKPARPGLASTIQGHADRLWSAAIDLNSALDDDRFNTNRAAITEAVLPKVRATALNLTDFLAALDLTATKEEARGQLATDLTHISETFQRLARSLQEESK